jgi:hypothetical protein
MLLQVADQNGEEGDTRIIPMVRKYTVFNDGVSLSTVNRAHMDFDHGGIKALKPKPSGGRLRENVTLAEEKALLARFSVPRSAAVYAAIEGSGTKKGMVDTTSR